MIDPDSLYNEALKYIAGGTQLLSKNPKVFSKRFPIYYKSAHGCMVVDLQDKVYYDMSFMGIGTCVLGYSDPDVNHSVIKSITSGNMSTLNNPDEVHLAKLLISEHPWAQKVRYTRGGGEAMAVAIRLARSATGKSKVMVCGYHGWHDWYLSANLESRDNLDNHLRKNLNPGGVPKELEGTCIPFTFNDVIGFTAKFMENVDDLSAVILEPMRYDKPTEEFLYAIDTLCRTHGVPLVFDEITSGCRTNPFGVYKIFGTEYLGLYNIQPDVVVYSKAISNGYPFGVVIGKDQVMSAIDKTFVSSTYWTESVGTSACLATINKLFNMDYSHLWKNMTKIGSTILKAGSVYNVPMKVKQGVLLHYDFPDYDIKEKYINLMLDRGYLVNDAYYPSFSHTDEIVDAYIDTTMEVFSKL